MSPPTGAPSDDPLHALLHRLWQKAANHPESYDPEEWNDLQAALWNLQGLTPPDPHRLERYRLPQPRTYKRLPPPPPRPTVCIDRSLLDTQPDLTLPTDTDPPDTPQDRSLDPKIPPG